MQPPRSQTVSGSEWAAFLRATATVEGKAVRQQQAVRQPEHDKAALKTLMSDLTHLVADTRRTAELAAAHSAGASASLHSVQADVGLADLASRAYGFKVCGQPH